MKSYSSHHQTLRQIARLAHAIEARIETGRSDAPTRVAIRVRTYNALDIQVPNLQRVGLDEALARRHQVAAAVWAAAQPANREDLIKCHVAVVHVQSFVLATKTSRAPGFLRPDTSPWSQLGALVIFHNCCRLIGQTLGDTRAG